MAKLDDFDKRIALLLKSQERNERETPALKQRLDKVREIYREYR
ncbi:MAG: hypothetical protein AB1567_01635 [bacterium]